VSQANPRAQRYAFWATGLILFCLWQVGSLSGALIGAAINPSDVGLDAAAPAVFLALLWPSLQRREARWVAAGGAAVALALIPPTPPGIPVLAAASVALVAGLRPTREVADVEDRRTT
jgi:predicted branched-subunit amino acid permease